MNRRRTTIQDRWLSEYESKQPRERKGVGSMKCPRCGDVLMHTEMEQVKAERCNSCWGVYFDRDDLDFLLHAHEPEHLLNLLRGMLTPAQPKTAIRPSHLEL